MKSMIWHPEERDVRVNQYLTTVNHAPYPAIAGMLFAGFCLFTLLVLFGT